jgi:hypothetical protein
MLSCKRGEVKPGTIQVHPGTLGGFSRVIFAATKDRWRNPSKLLWVETIIDTLAETVTTMGLAELSIAVPGLGCGQGGLPWPKVQMRMKVAFEKVPDVEWVLYAPPGQQYSSR